jgi:predicted nucleic acid-binding protein
MILYLDTSALVKRYFYEPHSDDIISRRFPEEFVFACFDEKLAGAAHSEGLETFPQPTEI